MEEILLMPPNLARANEPPKVQLSCLHALVKEKLRGIEWVSYSLCIIMQQQERSISYRWTYKWSELGLLKEHRSKVLHHNILIGNNKFGTAGRPETCRFHLSRVTRWGILEHLVQFEGESWWLCSSSRARARAVLFFRRGASKGRTIRSWRWWRWFSVGHRQVNIFFLCNGYATTICTCSVRWSRLASGCVCGGAHLLDGGFLWEW